MEFGLRLPTYDFGDCRPDLKVLQDFARVAEQLGFDSIWAVDHLMIAEPSYHVSFLEPTLVLAAVIGATERVQLGTSVLNLPLRHPIMVAKQAATLDALSGGRFSLGIGAGWKPEEFDVLGIPFASRGRRCDEYLAAMTALWRGEPTRFDGQFVSFADFALRPRTVRTAGPTLCIGGGSAVPAVYTEVAPAEQGSANIDRVLRRVARYADEWHAPSISNTSALAGDWARIEVYAREAGRSPAQIARVQTSYLVLGTESVARAKFERVMGKDFDAYIRRASFLFGEPDDIIQVLLDRAGMGFSRMILTPLDFDVRQLADWVDCVIEPFRREFSSSPAPTADDGAREREHG